MRLLVLKFLYAFNEAISSIYIYGGITGKKLHYPWFCSEIYTNQTIATNWVSLPALAICLNLYKYAYFAINVKYTTSVCKIGIFKSVVLYLCHWRGFMGLQFLPSLKLLSIDFVFLSDTFLLQITVCCDSLHNWLVCSHRLPL